MTSTVVEQDATGRKIVRGVYAASGTTQAIATGLTKVTFFSAFSSANATAPYASTISGGTITITVANNDSGWWKAEGY